MTITETSSAAERELKIEGRLDAATAPQLEAKIQEALPGAAHLTLDLSGVEYISSMGLRVILSAQKAAGRGTRLVLKKPSEFCMQVFEATGMATILTIRR